MKKIIIPIVVVSIYLLAYQIAPFIGAKPVIIASMFGISPFIVVWMVIRILKDGEHTGQELAGEFGYEDYNHNTTVSEIEYTVSANETEAI